MPKHPQDPESNVSKFSGYNPEKYAIGNVSLTIRTNEDLIPGKPPCLTQQSIAKYLQPLTRALVEVPPRPSIDELPDAVIDQMVQKDKAFWVDKPGANAYTLHDAYYNYGLTTSQVKPTHQDVFPRSYQYDLDCVRYRQFHANDGTKQKDDEGKLDGGSQKNMKQKRWKYYPKLTAPLSVVQTRERMDEVGRPFRNEVCNWYYDNYPSEKYDVILRKFSK